MYIKQRYKMQVNKGHQPRSLLQGSIFYRHEMGGGGTAGILPTFGQNWKIPPPPQKKTIKGPQKEKKLSKNEKGEAETQKYPFGSEEG